MGFFVCSCFVCFVGRGCLFVVCFFKRCLYFLYHASFTLVSTALISTSIPQWITNFRNLVYLFDAASWKHNHYSITGLKLLVISPWKLILLLLMALMYQSCMYHMHWTLLRVASKVESCIWATGEPNNKYFINISHSIILHTMTSTTAAVYSFIRECHTGRIWVPHLVYEVSSAKKKYLIG